MPENLSDILSPKSKPELGRHERDVLVVLGSCGECTAGQLAAAIRTYLSEPCSPQAAAKSASSLVRKGFAERTSRSPVRYKRTEKKEAV